MQNQLVFVPKLLVRAVNLALLTPLLHFSARGRLRNEQRSRHALAPNVVKKAPVVNTESYLLI